MVVRPIGLRASIPVFILFFVSGLTGLVYQVIWLRQFTLIFGATAYASSAVLSTFMGGLALGSYWAGRRADRWSDSPLRSYGKLELGIAAYAAAIPYLLGRMTPLLELAWRLGADRHFAIFGVLKFFAIAALVLPATTLMGATLPVLSRVVTSSARSLGGGVGALYAVNTLGAVAGTVVSAFLALPAFGMKRTLLANILVNVLVGAIAWGVGGRLGAAPRSSTEGADEPTGAGRPPRMLLLAFAMSGFAAMVLEVAWTRGLALVLGSSVYAYASMLTAFLLGLASGAGSASRFLERRRDADPRTVLALVLGAAGALSFAAGFAIQQLPRLSAEIYFRLHPSAEGWWLAQIGMSLLLMFPTTYALGWVFPLVLEAAGGRKGTIASSVGRVYASNTLGTIVGAAAGGFLLIPMLGVGSTLVGVAVIQLLLGASLLLKGTAGRIGPRRSLAFALVASALFCVVFRPSWDVVLMNSGVYLYVKDADPKAGWQGFIDQERADNHIVYARDGLTSTVVVGYESQPEDLYLTVNGKADASSYGDLDTQILLGQLPFLFHAAPRDVLIIGLASGITAGSAAVHPVERLRVVEVEGAIVGATRLFGPYNHDVLNDPRLTISINDARNELQFNRNEYDIIVSEPSNPWMTVASNLFTREFFRIVRSRVRAGGIFEQWVQTYGLAPNDLRSILAAFHSAFPHVLAFETPDSADLLLLGSDRPLVLDTAAVDQRMSKLWVKAEFARIDMSDAKDIASLLKNGGDAFSELVRGARVNTDDNGLVEFGAPKTLYIEAQRKNVSMIEGSSPDPMAPLTGLIRTPEDPDSLRLDLMRRWVGTDDKPRAVRAVSFFTNTTLKSEAEKLLLTSP